MSETELIIVPADKIAKFVLNKGSMRLWYDDEKNEVVIQSDAKGVLVVKPRAHNSVALGLESEKPCSTK